MKWFISLIMFSILPILYFFVQNQASPKKNLILSVTLTYSLRGDARVEEITGEFRRSLKKTCLWLTAAFFPSLCFRHFSLILGWQMCWLLVVCILPFVPFVRARKKLIAVKKEWMQSEAGGSGETFSAAAGRIAVDLKAAAGRKPSASGWWFVPPFLISLIPVVYLVGWDRQNPAFGLMLGTYLMDAMLILMFAFFHHWAMRQRSERIDEDTELTMALTWYRRHYWCLAWIASAWLTGALNLCLFLFLEDSFWLIVTTFGYAVLVLGIVCLAEFRVRKIQEKLTADSGKQTWIDEDEHWLLGMFYYNPNDSHWMVNDRIGMGATVNLASGAGKALMGVAVLCLLAIPVMSVWLIVEEFTPVSLTWDAQEEAIVAGHIREEYRIPAEEVDELELTDEFRITSKINGSAMDGLQKGLFKEAELGACRLCRDPGEGPWILIRTKDGTVYILGDKDAAVTEEVYEEAEAALAP